MEMLSQVAESMQEVLTSEAERIGAETELIQRQRKLRADILAQTLVFGWLENPDASLEDLTQVAASLGVSLSPQSLDQRFSQTTATFLKGLLESSLCQVVRGEPSALELLGRFEGVYLLDGSTLVLPDALSQEWEGCGGSSAQNTSSSLKLQARWDLVCGALSLELMSGRASDRASSYQSELLPAGSLRLTDLGYFDLGTFGQIESSGGYWLSRIQSQCVVYVPSSADSPAEEPARDELADYLQAQTLDRIEVSVLLGAEAKLPCRLIAQRVPEEVANQRRRKLRAHAKKKGKTPSRRRLVLADWTVLATNAPEHLIGFKAAFVLARLRWQIELLFKLFKSHGKVDEWRSQKPWRILCEVYAKLIGVIIQHWLLLSSGWRFGKKSLVKAAKAIRKQVMNLVSAFAKRGTARGERLMEVLQTLRFSIQAGCWMNSRKASPNTYQLLMDIHEELQN